MVGKRLSISRIIEDTLLCCLFDDLGVADLGTNVLLVDEVNMNLESPYLLQLLAMCSSHASVHECKGD